MPTNDERREVAARLRALDVYEFDDGEYIDEGQEFWERRNDDGR